MSDDVLPGLWWESYSTVGALSAEVDVSWALDILANPHIVQQWNKSFRFVDEPFLHQYAAITAAITLEGACSGEGSDAGGASFSADRAVMKAAGEAAERLCCSFIPKERIIRGSFSQVSPLLDPELFKFFSSSQLANANFERFRWSVRDEFSWINGKDSLTHNDIYLPAQLAFVPYQFDNEPGIFPPISTGAAAGHSLEHALLNGSLELIEREAFMVYWLNRIEPISIDVTSNESLNEIKTYFARYSLDLRVFQLLTDAPAYCFLVVIIDTSTQHVPAPWISAGMKVGFDVVNAIVGAIEEAWHTRPWVRALLQDRTIEGESKSPQKIQSIPERALYWSDRSLKQEVSFILESEQVKAVADLISTQGPAYGPQTLLNFFAANGHNLFHVDITCEAVAAQGLKVVKVICPTLQQFHLIEPFVALNCQRRLELPRSLGLVSSEAPNLTPHFFL